MTWEQHSVHLNIPHLHVSHIKVSPCQHGVQAPPSPGLSTLLLTHCPYSLFVVLLRKKKKKPGCKHISPCRAISYRSLFASRSVPFTLPAKPFLLLDHCWNNLQDLPQPSLLTQGMPGGPGVPVMSWWDCNNHQLLPEERGTDPPAQGTAAACAYIPWCSGVGWVLLTVKQCMPAGVGVCLALLRMPTLFLLSQISLTDQGSTSVEETVRGGARGFFQENRQTPKFLWTYFKEVLQHRSILLTLAGDIQVSKLGWCGPDETSCLNTSSVDQGLVSVILVLRL